MKIIFLDIDGVLNDAPTIMEKDNDLPAEPHLSCLKQIVDATGAEIVLSSMEVFLKRCLALKMT